jgi:hypothetical protein
VGQSFLALWGCGEIGHHGSYVKIGERPDLSPGDRTVARNYGFERIEDAAGSLKAGAN